MRNLSRAVLAAALSLTALNTASAQQANQVEWKQTFNMPKGTNLPPGVRADTLGIELGDTYAEAKAKLAQLASEGVQAAPDKRSMSQRMIDRNMGRSERPPVTESQVVFRLQGPGGNVIAAAYVAEAKLERELPGSGPQKLTEIVTLYFSAPSSGHQVIGIERLVAYPTNADQPRASDLLGPLKAKYKSEPQVSASDTTTTYKFQFNDGKPFVSPPRIVACDARFKISEEREIPSINPNKDCDVVALVRVVHGISRDHAKSLTFTLADNERAQANIAADFDFFGSYVSDLQNRTRGAPPKL